MAITGLHHIGVFCRDIDASLEFYMDKLGYELDRRVSLGEGASRLAFISLGSCKIELICPPADQYKQRGEGQVAHICMQVEDIEKEVAELRAKGVVFAADAPSKLPAFGDNAANIFFEGPDGERLELFQ